MYVYVISINLVIFLLRQNWQALCEFFFFLEYDKHFRTKRKTLTVIG